MLLDGFLRDMPCPAEMSWWSSVKVWDEEAEGGGYMNKDMLAANQEMYTISVKRRKGSDTLNSETCVHDCIGGCTAGIGKPRKASGQGQ